MGLPRYAAQRDHNEPSIIQALEKIGAQVEQMKLPCDLLVRFRGQMFVLEVDNPASKYRKRKPDQLKFLQEWGVPLVQTPEDALKAIGAMT
jgi:hypothetical protein